eukprot:COSAG02_NODE_1790_length_10923_cov_6.773004_1_plen_75_part_10
MNRKVVVRTKFLPTGFLLSEFHRGASKRTGLNADGTVGEFRVVGDSTQSNAITKDICYPTAHLDDSIASINEVAI